jgi:hypothetical protein
MINTTAEHLAPQVEALANAKVSLFSSFFPRTPSPQGERSLMPRFLFFLLLPNSSTRVLCQNTHTPTHTQVGIKILSNLADRRLVHAYTSIPVERLATPTIDGMQE